MGPGPEMKSDEDIEELQRLFKEHNLEAKEGWAGATCDKFE